MHDGGPLPDSSYRSPVYDTELFVNLYSPAKALDWLDTSNLERQTGTHSHQHHHRSIRRVMCDNSISLSCSIDGDEMRRLCGVSRAHLNRKESWCWCELSCSGIGSWQITLPLNVASDEWVAKWTAIEYLWQELICWRRRWLKIWNWTAVKYYQWRMENYDWLNSKRVYLIAINCQIHIFND